MTISPLSIGALNNGWLVSLNTVIAAFNVDHPTHPVPSIPAGIINDGYEVAIQWLVSQMNTKLTADGYTNIAAIAGQTYNNGWEYMLKDVITKYNSSTLV